MYMHVLLSSFHPHIHSDLSIDHLRLSHSTIFIMTASILAACRRTPAYCLSDCCPVLRSSSVPPCVNIFVDGHPQNVGTQTSFSTRLSSDKRILICFNQPRSMCSRCRSSTRPPCVWDPRHPSILKLSTCHIHSNIIL